MVKRLATALVLLTVLPSCAVQGLAFVKDDRVSILTPDTNEEVTLPFEVTWEAEDYDGHYGVFFDRTPMRPGASLESLVPEGDVCRTEPGCPDAEWLADRGVFVTKEPRLVLETLLDRRQTNRAKDRHEFTIILLDDGGRRIGESAFIREFIVSRED